MQCVECLLCSLAISLQENMYAAIERNREITNAKQRASW